MTNTPDEFLLAELIIRRVMRDGEETITVESRDLAGDIPNPIEQLGILRMAEHLILTPTCDCDDESEDCE